MFHGLSYERTRTMVEERRVYSSMYDDLWEELEKLDVIAVYTINRPEQYIPQSGAK